MTCEEITKKTKSPGSHKSLWSRWNTPLPYKKTSLASMTLPGDWKQAHVSALYKKGNRQDPGNYRPVSLTSVVGKEFIRDWFVLHLRENNILSPQQFRFVSGRSTSLQLLHLLNTLTKVFDKGGEVDVVYMNLQKAFDSIPHERMMAKLEGYGVRDPILSWVRSFLCGRRQRVPSKHNTTRQWRLNVSPPSTTLAQH